MPIATMSLCDVFPVTLYFLINTKVINRLYILISGGKLKTFNIKNIPQK